MYDMSRLNCLIEERFIHVVLKARFVLIPRQYLHSCSRLISAGIDKQRRVEGQPLPPREDQGGHCGEGIAQHAIRTKHTLSERPLREENKEPLAGQNLKLKDALAVRVDERN